MITLVEALGFRCLRYVHRPLGGLQILVGPNASGKTTFLDVISFLGDFVSGGEPQAVLQGRTNNPLDLFWARKPGALELAIEAKIPERLHARLPDQQYDTIRYEVEISADPETLELSIAGERALFKVRQRIEPMERSLFPEAQTPPASILSPKSTGQHYIVNKVAGGNDNFYPEIHAGKRRPWASSYKFGPHKSSLSSLPPDESKFPVTIWLKGLLERGIQRIVLNNLALRRASPPGQPRGFRPDGSNLPWVIRDLQQAHPAMYKDWLAHVRTALPDVEDIRIVIREDDKHAYLILRYSGGLEAPSWVVSDGTLRLLALTILAYVPEFNGIYLIEEPENGIHPTAVETVYQSLSSVYSGQVLVASHSPVLLGVARPEQLLCFARTADGAVDIVRGDEHPALRDWKGETSLGALFASGILG